MVLYHKLHGKIELVTGLHIGAGKEALRIGACDSPVIKDQKGYPYIPGSSLKGKLRSLLTLKYNADERIDLVFGVDQKSQSQIGAKILEKSESKNAQDVLMIPRALFRDCYIDKEWLRKNPSDLYEYKMETAIDRTNGKARGGSLREIERVLPGVIFSLEIVLRIFDNNERKVIIDFLKEGLDLLSNDYLGGMGTRGYGQVKIHDLKVEELGGVNAS